MTVTIDQSGRILIPKPLRDRLGLAPGTAVALAVQDSGDGAPSLALRREDETALVREGPLLVHRGRLTDSDFDTVKLLKDQRAERAERHAGLGGYER